jgi:chemotaxis protein methyltransferase CheR
VSGDLEALFALVTRRSGSALSKQQRDRVKEAAAALAHGRPTAALLAHLETVAGARDLLQLLAAASVHKTDLFRDEVQLNALAEHVLPAMATSGRALQVWSAGCATGEEVATLLLLLDRAGCHPSSRVLGTDLSPSALERARRFTFSEEAMRRVPPALTQAAFRAGKEGFTLSPSLQTRVRFLQHNLMETPYPYPEAGTHFDLIACRNVLIYFTPEAVDRTVALLAERLAPGGVLMLSVAEPLLDPRTDLEALRVGGSFFYRHRSTRAAPPTAAAVAPPPRPSAPAPIAAAPEVRAPMEPPAAQTPEDEGAALFSLVLDWSAAGQGDLETEAGLRKALYLSPQLAAARYCLGRLLEQRGSRSDAITEYRRALALLEQGTARPTPFFLRLDRLAGACRMGLERLKA